MRRTIALLATAATLLVPAVAGATDGLWQAREQQLVYQINRARHDPARFAAALGYSGAGLLPRPPLAVDATLAASADFRADDLADGGPFSHISADGRWPNEVARDLGYPLPWWWLDDANQIESIAVSAAGFPWGLIFRERSTHLDHLLGQGGFVLHRQIGVGADGNYWSVHTAYREGGPAAYLTGVVFADDDRDEVMDLDEGLAGVTVSVAGVGSTRTGPGGGWTVAVPRADRYQLTVSGGGFLGTATAAVRVTEYNVGVDFISGRAEGRVFEYALCRGREPTMLGTGGGDSLVGTSGPDVIQALGGDDVVRGGGGNDIICGGAGDDRLLGEDGDDRIAGGPGSDTIDGGEGSGDICRGEALAACED